MADKPTSPKPPKANPKPIPPKPKPPQGQYITEGKDPRKNGEVRKDSKK